jgi:ribosomal protein S25
MGGKKRLSLKQMEKQQSKRGKTEKKKGKATGSEESQTGIVSPDPENKSALDELKKMRVLTSYAVASRLNLRVSAAKQFLIQLEDRGLIKKVAGNHSLKIYKLVN